MATSESYSHRTFRFALAILGFYRKLTRAIEPLMDEVDQLIAILTTTVRKLRASDKARDKASAQ